jgi:retron-type reverse transcriptase
MAIIGFILFALLRLLGLAPVPPRIFAGKRRRPPPKVPAGAHAKPAPPKFTPGKFTPPRRTLDTLAKRLGYSTDALRAMRPAYTEFRKQKRGGGVRVLFAPDANTKGVQRRILALVLNASRSHPAAYGYERGRGTVDHANVHAGQAVVIGIDIRDFFPSTDAAWVREYFIAVGWDAKAAGVLTKLTTHDGSLPQGAPTSPKLSNLVNHLLDARLQALAKAFGARYSRYADDITFSLAHDDQRLVKNLVNLTSSVLFDCGYQMHNKKKLFVRRKHQRQQICGLVVNNGPPRVSRETKRMLRAVEHRLAKGKKATLTREQVAGWRGYIAMVEGKVAGGGERK